MKNIRKFWVLLFLILPFASMLSAMIPFSVAEEERKFTYGLQYAPSSFEPLDSTDSSSLDVMNQVYEGLYAHNVSSSQMELIPRLATSLGTWSPDYKELTINLRSGVTFHDGSEFNATVVKWNIDRIIHHMVDLDDIFYSFNFKVDDKWILDSCDVLGNLQVKINLNFAATHFESLLAESFMVMIKSNTTYWDGLIQIGDPLIGTGPYKYTSWVEDKIQLDYFPTYYRGWTGNYLDQILIEIESDAEELYEKIMNYTIDCSPMFSSQYVTEYESNSDLTYMQDKSSLKYYVCMNVLNVPFELRSAVTYAFNYSQFLTGFSIPLYELRSPVVDGMPHHISGFPGEPYFNVSKAREIMLGATSPGLAVNVSSSGLTSSSIDIDWIAVAGGSSPLAWVNYTYHASSLNYLIALQLQEDLRMIGVKMSLNELTWGEYYTLVSNPAERYKLSFTYGAWGPDFYDPINQLQEIYGTDGSVNYHQLSNSTVDTVLNLTYSSTGPTRGNYFELLQEYIVVDIAATLFLFQRAIQYVYNNKRLFNVDHFNNIKNTKHFYDCQFLTHYSPDEPILDAITPNPSYTGLITLSWNSDPDADLYHIYRHSSLLTEVNGSVSYLGNTSTNTWLDTVLTNGTYYYAVLMQNESGYSDVSNSQSVLVEITTPEAPILLAFTSPQSENLITIDWDESVNAEYYKVYQYSSLITDINGSVADLGIIYTYEGTFTTYSAGSSGWYYFAVEAYNAAGPSDLSNSEGIFITLAPTLTPVTPDPSATGDVHIDWNDESHIESYTVYRYTSLITEINSSVTELGDVAVSEYDDTGLTNGVYYYAVVANYNEGSSDVSNSVSVQVELTKPKIPGFPSALLILVSISMIGFLLWKNKQKH
ncbi:MAG: ABC transporter substrate-binding protein [Promethearchaeota archaeon]